MSKLLEISEEERTLLESSEQGKAFLKKLEAAEVKASSELDVSRAKAESEAKARKEMEEKLFSPDFLETLAQRGTKKVEEAEDLDSVTPKELFLRLQKQMNDAVVKQREEMQKTATELLDRVSAGFVYKELEELEEKHGEGFKKSKDALVKFAGEPGNEKLRPKQLWNRFQEKLELEAKRVEDAKAKELEAAREKAQKAFAENPEETISSSATSPKEGEGDSFDKAWAATPGIEKLTRTD